MNDELRTRAERNLEAMRADPDTDWPDRLLDRPGRPEPERLDLSPAEYEALRWYASGLWPRDIARVTGRTLAVVDTQLKVACRKLGAKHRGHACAIAVRERLF